LYAKLLISDMCTSTIIVHGRQRGGERVSVT